MSNFTDAKASIKKLKTMDDIDAKLRGVFDNSSFQLTVENEWISVNLQNLFSVRGDFFKVTKRNKLMVGSNIMVNRMLVLNGKIPLA